MYTKKYILQDGFNWKIVGVLFIDNRLNGFSCFWRN